MTRQENAVPIFTYENEERDPVYAERRQGDKRNPYLADYAAQRGRQRGRQADAAYVTPIDWRSERKNVRGGRPAETERHARTSRADGGMRRRRPGEGMEARAMRPMERDGERRSRRFGDAGDTRYSGYRAVTMNATRFDRYGEEDDAIRSGCRPVSAQGRPVRTSGCPMSSGDSVVASRSAASSRRAASAQGRPVRTSGRPASSGGFAASSRRSATQSRSAASSGRITPSGRAAAANRKKRVFLQRLAIGLWVLGIFVLAMTIMFKDGRVSAALNNQEDTQPVANMGENTPDASGKLVQGLPAEEFARHPDWTENLLTPNEYSRPGDPLESVTNIFVHYTANPGTSAAQNRSYFEQQKDTHERSVSAHFIIGYEGEIIQCVPLDEIAYAVATRNFDSVSIECCYREKDGSFTQETYDSLISLLAWLVDVYDLDSNDILRHYDCGGKKCPLYYTNHPGEWEQLKKDVDNLSSGT